MGMEFKSNDIVLNTPKQVEVPDVHFRGVDTGFVINDYFVKYPVREDLEVTFTDSELIEKLDHLFGVNPELVRSLNRNFNQGLKAIEEVFKVEFEAELDFEEVYKKLPRVHDFLNLVSLGLLVGLGYTNAVSYQYKVFYKSPRVSENSIYVRKTNLGLCFKSIPILQVFTKDEFNSVMSKFYKSQLLGVSQKTNGDYFSYFNNFIPDQEAVRNIELFNDDEIRTLKDAEIAAILAENLFSPKALNKVQAAVSKPRMNKIVMIARLMSKK